MLGLKLLTSTFDGRFGDMMALTNRQHTNKTRCILSRLRII